MGWHAWHAASPHSYPWFRWGGLATFSVRSVRPPALLRRLPREPHADAHHPQECHRPRAPPQSQRGRGSCRGTAPCQRTRHTPTQMRVRATSRPHTPRQILARPLPRLRKNFGRDGMLNICQMHWMLLPYYDVSYLYVL